MARGLARQTASALAARLRERLAAGQAVALYERKRAPAAADALAVLAHEVDACRCCGLGSRRIKAVFGQGNPRARVVCIGEGPRYEEDRQGLPFVGKAGALLDRMLVAIQLDRTSVYIANVVKCHPMRNPAEPESRGNDRPPTGEEAAACLPYLIRQIELIRPLILFIMGGTAMKYVLGIEEAVGRMRGRFLDFHGVRALVTYHPAALLRDPSLKAKSWEDLKLLRDALNESSV